MIFKKQKKNKKYLRKLVDRRTTQRRRVALQACRKLKKKKKFKTINQRNSKPTNITLAKPISPLVPRDITISLSLLL